MLLLDASKTFDRIEYSTLFNNLRRQDMCVYNVTINHAHVHIIENAS